MRAVTIERFGDPSGMVVTDVPAPAPGPGQVVIETEAMGVGGVDAVIRRGTISGYGFTTGLIPGSEVAGTVTAVGTRVDRSWTGRRVWAFTRTGGYAEQALAQVGDVVALADGLSSIADFGKQLISAFQQSRSVATFSLDSIPTPARDTVRAELFAAATRGELHAVVHDVLPLDQAAEAHRQMDAGSVFGRIVLVP